MKHSVKELILSNGAKGLLIDVPDATVMTVEINFRAGDYLVTKEKWETPHLMEHVLLGANQKIRKARSFQAEFEKNGAYCNASTGSYDITYESECADFEWERIADLIILAITKPLFLNEEFEAEFGNVVEELNYRSNNHFRHLSLALRSHYGFAVLTDQERLKLMKNVALSDIKKHYHRTHTTSNMRFVIAGKITPERQKSLLKKFSNFELPAGDGRLELPDEELSSLDRALYIDVPTVDNMHFYFDTFRQSRLRDPEFDALNLVNNMLTETLHSRILGAAREQGLVYSMSSGVGGAKKSANWWFGAQITPANAHKLFAIMRRELLKVLNGKLESDDISAAKQFSLGRYQRGAQTVSGTASGYSGRYFFDDVISDYYAVPARIEAINMNRIVKASNSLFESEIWGFGVLGNCGQDFAEELREDLKKLWA